MRKLKGLIWLQIALIVLCIAVYAVVWLRVQSLIAARQQLLQEITTQQQQRDELRKQIAALEEQKNSLNESVRALAAKISSLQGTGRQLQELKGEAVKAWEKFPPKQAWCYQERDPRKPSEKRYSVHCHWSQDRCNTAKAGSKIATSCALVPNVDTAAWQPSSKGYMDSWFQLDRTSPLPPPFPQDFPEQQTAETTSPPKEALPQPPAPQSPPKPIRITVTKQEDAERMVVNRVNPEFPEEARLQRIDGDVLLRLTIDKDGNLKDTEFVSGPEQLRQSAIDCVQKWKFRPYEYHGEPVEAKLVIRVGFKFL